MEKFIPIRQAGILSGLAETILIQLVSNGRIKAIESTEGRVMVKLDDVENMIPLRQRAAYEPFQQLAETPISISAAARKYNVPQQTITRWLQKKFPIAVLGTQGRKKLISEGDVAYFCVIYQQAGGHQGRWVFKGDGIPYIASQK